LIFLGGFVKNPSVKKTLKNKNYKNNQKMDDKIRGE
jgi:hypothetical protein